MVIFWAIFPFPIIEYIYTVIHQRANMLTYGIGGRGKEISVRNGSFEQSTRLSFTEATLFCSIFDSRMSTPFKSERTHFGYAPALAVDHPRHAPTYPLYVGAYGDVYIVTNESTMLHDRWWLARKIKALASFGTRTAGTA